ncbi:MAG TPA: hypothetical protein VIR33_00885, partial [Thermopolyspora sp.]
MNFCLSDLVPPLRWSDAARIRELRELGDDSELPGAWWRALPIERVLAIADAERLGKLLAVLTLEHWPSAAVGDILPALYVLDPDEADEPQVAIALDRTGSWPGLLALTGHELRDQPFIQAMPVLTTLFGAVFARLAPPARPAEPAPVKHLAAVRPSSSAPLPEDDPEPEAPAEAQPEVPAPREAAEQEPGQEAQREAELDAGPEARPGTEQEAGSEAEREPAEADAMRGAAPATPLPLAQLIDAAFADLDDQTWVVAQNRVFTDAPSEVEQLAKLFAVPPERIQALEEELRARLAMWLTAPETAPYRDHLTEMADMLGVAAPKSRLISAADWHQRELRSLDVPAWQFVLTTLPEYHVAGDWLVVGDLAELHEKTRGLIVNAERPPTVTRALELVSTLGIHPEVAKEWLENVPQLRIQSTGGRGGVQSFPVPVP